MKGHPALPLPAFLSALGLICRRLADKRDGNGLTVMHKGTLKSGQAGICRERTQAAARKHAISPTTALTVIMMTTDGSLKQFAAGTSAAPKFRAAVARAITPRSFGANPAANQESAKIPT